MPEYLPSKSWLRGIAGFGRTFSIANAGVKFFDNNPVTWFEAKADTNRIVWSMWSVEGATPLLKCVLQRSYLHNALTPERTFPVP